MLFKILRLFGLDVPAQIEAVKARFEEGVEQATDHVKLVAQEAAIIAAFSLVATVTAAVAVGIGLMAIYRLIAQDYGPYLGFATDGALLLVMSGICAAAAVMKTHALAGPRTKSPALAARKSAPIDPAPLKIASHNDTSSATSSARSVVPVPSTSSANASATDLAEPLSTILSTYLKSRIKGNPIAEGLMGNLGPTTASTAMKRLSGPPT
jgi:hypothetical protein